MVKRQDSTYNYFLFDSNSEYPDIAPYHPGMQYPEYPFGLIESADSVKNDVYRMIREMLAGSGMDRENYDSPEWNPLGTYIKRGDTVLIKPNLVMHDNPMEDSIKRKMECMITHPSVVRCLFDYVFIALKGEGKIIIADAPVQDCNFDELLNRSGYGSLFRYLIMKETESLHVQFADLRDCVLYNDGGRKRQKTNENKRYGETVVDLKEKSYFYEICNGKRLRVTNYASKDTIEHHNYGKNEYCISDIVLKADVIINIPKPKTHRIAGFTAALKNMIGINTRKEYLPHHQQGAKNSGGDEYTGRDLLLKYLNSKGNDIKNWGLKHQYNFVSDIANDFARKIGIILDHKERDRKKFGMWYGNDTIWRTILDVNHIVHFCGKDGLMHTEKQRMILHFGDMIVCGEKEGPLHPSYKKVGGILFSDNPVTFDYCVVKLMGLDYIRFPVMVNALKDKRLINMDVESVHRLELHSNDARFNKVVDDIEDNFGFMLASGWRV